MRKGEARRLGEKNALELIATDIAGEYLVAERAGCRIGAVWNAIDPRRPSLPQSPGFAACVRLLVRQQQ
jgi:hypothetical protein